MTHKLITPATEVPHVIDEMSFQVPPRSAFEMLDLADKLEKIPKEMQDLALLGAGLVYSGADEAVRRVHGETATVRDIMANRSRGNRIGVFAFYVTEALGASGILHPRLNLNRTFSFDQAYTNPDQDVLDCPANKKYLSPQELRKITTGGNLLEALTHAAAISEKAEEDVPDENKLIGHWFTTEDPELGFAGEVCYLTDPTTKIVRKITTAVRERNSDIRLDLQAHSENSPHLRLPPYQPTQVFIELSARHTINDRLVPIVKDNLPEQFANCASKIATYLQSE